MREFPFQSLRGFGVGWSGHGFEVKVTIPEVSIPERVWGGLEPVAERYPGWATACFNP